MLAERASAAKKDKARQPRLPSEDGQAESRSLPAGGRHHHACRSIRSPSPTSRDIKVEGKPDTADGVSGMLLRHGNNFGIVYATHIPSEGFQRFSIGHELGHYFLDGHVDQILPKDGVHVSRAGFVSADPYELEADQFAAGPLMPETPPSEGDGPLRYRPRGDRDGRRPVPDLAHGDRYPLRRTGRTPPSPSSSAPRDVSTTASCRRR